MIERALHAVATRSSNAYVHIRYAPVQDVNLNRTARFAGIPIISSVCDTLIQVGARASIVSMASQTALGVNHRTVIRTMMPGAVIDIQEDVGISGATICSAVGIVIGAGTLVGANTTIVDTDFHLVSPSDSAHRRYAPMPPPRDEDQVIIGKNVFIGMNCTILKGVTVGDGAVVGAGSVLRRSVEAHTVYLGSRG